MFLRAEPSGRNQRHFGVLTPLNFWGAQMTRAEEYKQYAVECVRIAQLVTNPDERMHLLEMAQKWRELAERAEREPEPDR